LFMRMYALEFAKAKEAGPSSLNVWMVQFGDIWYEAYPPSTSAYSDRSIREHKKRALLMVHTSLTVL
jgi:hypothetical protein